MSTCSQYKFTITRGHPNTFVFTVKADGSTLPMEITGSDTFMVTISSLEDSTTVLSKLATVKDALSGSIQLDLTTAEADQFVADRGSKVDRYYTRPSYKLVIECTTANNGNFLAKVDEVYVD